MGLTTMSALRSITFFSFVIFVAGRDPVTTIEPSYGPDWGEWNGGVLCPDNTFAHGFEQKTDSWCSGGGECTGLNGIQMMCGRLEEETHETIRSTRGCGLMMLVQMVSVSSVTMELI